MRIPAVVRVGPMAYDVRAVEGLADDDGNRLLGEADFRSARISIDAGAGAQVLLAGLIHEILHIVLEQAGHMEAAADENLIRALCFGLMNVSLDGRPLLRWLPDSD